MGWAWSVSRGEWPVQTFALIACNDVVWWLPFGLFLIDDTRLGEWVRARAPVLCALVNAAAAVAMAAAVGGQARAVFAMADSAGVIAGHLAGWQLAWLLWLLAGQSLIAFYAWWGSRWPSSAWTFAAVALGVAGAACDALGQSWLIGWAPDRLTEVARAATLLTSGAANGLYTLAGIILTLRTSELRGWLGVWTWACWLTGICLTVFALADHVTGMVASVAAMMPLFCLWLVVVGRRLQ
jgi:hypothetical protein